MTNRVGLLVAILSLAVVGFAVYEWRLSGLPPVGLDIGAVKAAGGTETVPWIDLDRLKTERAHVDLGRRDIFQWVVTPPPTPPPTPQPTLDPNATPSPTAPPTQTPLPPAMPL